MPSKKWYASKTLWINGIAVLLAAITALDKLIPAEWLPYMIAVQGIANIVLRLLKNEQITPIEGFEPDIPQQAQVEPEKLSETETSST